MAVSRAFDGIMSKSLGLFGLADHGTELDSSQSDRLMLTSAGNTASISQRAVAPTVTGVMQAEKFLSALDMPMSKETVAEKGYVVATGDWTTSQVEGTLLAEVDFPDVLKSAAYAINGMLSYHQYIRCGIDVLVQINPTEWQVGGLIAWIESCQDSSSKNYTNFNNIPTYPSGFLNCNVNNEVRLKQPFVFSRNHFTLHGKPVQPDNLFTLRLAVWSQMAVATGTSTKVAYKITAMLRDVTMHGIRVQSTQMMRGYTASPGVRIEHGIGMLNCSNMAELKVNGHLTMGCEGFEVDSSMAGGVKAENFDHHLQTPSRFARLAWKTTETSGTMLAEWLVHPRQPANTYTTWAGGKCSTNISLLSSLYRFWRGDLVFTFQVFATKWHSGRIVVAFTPGLSKMLSSSSSLKVVSTCTAAEYDIHGPQSTFTYRVPFISATQYLDCDPAKGGAGYLYTYVYNQLAAPNNVSTAVEIICSISGATNFELFVPSFNTIQAGDGDEIADSQQVATTSQASSQPALKEFSQSPMGALEMPQYKPSEGGIFPELKDGTVLHKKKHTDLQVMLGRAHHWLSYSYTTQQTFLHDEMLNWASITGFWSAMARCFTLFRGGLKLVIHAETFFDCELYVAFRPAGVETITSLESLMKYGLVSFSTAQTHQVVLKLPWYQPLAANSVFSSTDGRFGYVTLGGTNGGSIKLHYSLAFDTDSAFYFPRGCPVDSAFHPATVSSKLRYKRMVPDALSYALDSDHPVNAPAVDDTVDWTPGELSKSFVRDSVNRKGFHYTPKMLPQSAHTGPWLCSRNHDTLPIKHFFIKCSDGRKFGLYPANNRWVDHAEVREEFPLVYQHIEPADDMADVVALLVGPYYRPYHVLHFNCEHFARQYAGLTSGCSQQGRIARFLQRRQVEQAGGKCDTCGSEATTTMPCNEELCTGCLTTHDKCDLCRESPRVDPIVRAQIWPDRCECEATWDCREHACGRKFCHDCRHRHANCVECFGGAAAADTQGLGDLFKRKPTPVTTDDETPPVPPPKKNLFSKVRAKIKGTVREGAVEAGDIIMDKATDKMSHWIEHVLKPALTESGVKITRLVLAAISRISQVTCMIYTIVTHPVPSVIGPLCAIAALEGLHSLGRFILKDRPQAVDEDVDLTEEMGSIIYECIGGMVPQSAHPKNGLRGFLNVVKDISIMASGIRSIIVLCSWLVKIVMAILDYFFPRVTTSAAQQLQRETTSVSYFLACVAEINDAGDNICAEALDCLVQMGAYFWRLCITASEALKNRQLISQIEKAYSRLKSVATVRKLAMDGLPRVEPVVIWLHGKKGSGKSLASVAMAASICKLMGVDPRTNIYTKPVSAKYYDGYTGQKIMIMDDVGQNCGPTGTDYDDFCQLVSTAPLRLNMARLEEKGVCFTTPIIIASSNIAQPKPNSIVDDDAINRRIEEFRYMVVPQTKYQKKATGSGTLTTPSCILDVEAAMADNQMRRMTCCDFKRGTTETGKAETLDQISRAVFAKLQDKTETHKTLLETWYAMVDQQIPSKGPYVDYVPTPHNNKKVMKAVAKEMNVKNVTVVKIIPQWARVLLGLSIAVSLASAFVGAGFAVWHMANKVRNHEVSCVQGAYNVNSGTQPIKVPRSLAPMGEQSVTDMVNVMRDHMVQLGFRHKDTLNYKVLGCVVRGTQVLAPKHYYLSTKGSTILVKSRNQEYEYDRDDVAVIELKWDNQEMDAVLLTFPNDGFQKYKDITHHFVSAKDVLRVNGSGGVLVTHGPYGPTFVPEQNLQFCETTKYGSSIQYNPAGVYKGEACTLQGMCGGTLVSSLNKLQNAVLGIHVAGNGDCATTQIVTKEMFAQGPQSGRIVRVDDGPRLSMPSRTKFTLSPLAPYVDSGKIPAYLYSTCLTESDVFAVALSKYAQPVLSAPSDWAEYERSFTLWFMSQFGVTQGDLTLSEAINGIDGLDRINLKTSPGWPWCVSGMRKSDLICWSSEESEWVATPLLRDAVGAHREQVNDMRVNDIPTLTDVGCNLITYITYYKDELRPFEKVMSGKTRIIEAAPVHHVLGFRQVFGKGVAKLHKSPLSTGFAPGCDIELSSHSMFHRLHGMDMFDADYKNFDGTLQPFLMYSAMRCLAAISGVAPCDADRWASLLIYSHHYFAGLRIVVCGGMPSGSPATTIVNTICNMMMTYYLIRKVTGLPRHLLWSQVFVAAYGDDLVVGTSKGLEMPKYTMAWISAAYQVFRASITDASKGLVPVLKTIDEVVFLRRRFIADPEIPWMMHAALDKSSIRAMLEYQHESELFPERVRGALRFASHWGGAYYAKTVGIIAMNRDVVRMVGAIPTYSDMLADWRDRMTAA